MDKDREEGWEERAKLRDTKAFWDSVIYPKVCEGHLEGFTHVTADKPKYSLPHADEALAAKWLREIGYDVEIMYRSETILSIENGPLLNTKHRYGKE